MFPRSELRSTILQVPVFITKLFIESSWTSITHTPKHPYQDATKASGAVQHKPRKHNKNLTHHPPQPIAPATHACKNRPFTPKAPCHISLPPQPCPHPCSPIPCRAAEAGRLFPACRHVSHETRGQEQGSCLCATCRLCVVGLYSQPANTRAGNAAGMAAANGSRQE